jgi:hypothetical protein
LLALRSWLSIRKLTHQDGKTSWYANAEENSVQQRTCLRPNKAVAGDAVDNVALIFKAINKQALCQCRRKSASSLFTSAGRSC